MYSFKLETLYKKFTGKSSKSINIEKLEIRNNQIQLKEKVQEKRNEKFKTNNRN